MKTLPRFFLLCAVLAFVPVLVGWLPPLDPYRFMGGSNRESIPLPDGAIVRATMPPAPSDVEAREFTCQPTGEFNVVLDARRRVRQLRFETWCVERYPPAGAAAIFQVEDAIVTPSPSRGPAVLFRAPFERTVISVEGSVVTLHWRDDDEVFHDKVLRPQGAGKKYRYNFSQLVLNTATGVITIRAESEVRWLAP